MLTENKQSHMYCMECRALHAERSNPAKGKIDLPRCNKTNGKECEVIKIWIDQDNKQHKEPFVLNKNNFWAMEVYGLVTDLSEYQVISYSTGSGKNRKNFEATIPTLNMLFPVLDNLIPEHVDKEDIIEKIRIIHKIKINNTLR